MIIAPDFPWRAGMRDVGDHNVPFSRIVEVWPNGYPRRWVNEGEDGARYTATPEEAAALWRGVCSDLTDGATKGALLEAVRDAYGGRRLSVSWVPWGCQVLALNTYQNGAYDYSIVGEGADDGAALLAAWKARPR